LPDESTTIGQELADIVKTALVHGPYGVICPTAPCMKNIQQGRNTVCSKKYPRAFQERTTIQENGYPIYRRRNNGQSFTIPLQGGPPGMRHIVDNRWIIPYNPYLTWKYKAHINVEVCAFVQAVKYIHKYIFVCLFSKCEARGKKMQKHGGARKQILINLAVVGKADFVMEPQNSSESLFAL
jgi:hypothetical protein